MKRMLMLLLISSGFMLATPKGTYEIKTILIKNSVADEVSHVFTPNQQQFEFKHMCITPEEIYAYTINMKLLSVDCRRAVDEADVQYFVNREKPNPTSHETYKTIEVDISDGDMAKSIPCLADDDATLQVKIRRVPTVSCNIQ